MQSIREDITPMIQVEQVKWNSEQHTIRIGRKTITLTGVEYRLLFPLRDGHPLRYGDLAMMVYRCQIDGKVRVMLDKHIDRIRGKLRGSGIYIYCILTYGYVLLPEI